MTNGRRQLATLLCTLMCFDTVACAAIPLDFFEVVNVTPSRLINMRSNRKASFDNDVIENVLIGPQLFSHAVGSAHEAIQEPRAYLNWYEIAQAPKEPTRTVDVRDPLRGKTLIQSLSEVRRSYFRPLKESQPDHQVRFPMD